MTWACEKCGCSAPPRYNRCVVCKHLIDETFIKEKPCDGHPSYHMGALKDESPEYS